MELSKHRMNPGWLLLPMLLLAGSACAEDRTSVGIGLGAPYAGLGANVALASDRDFKFLGAGCIGRQSTGSGVSNACGVGIGWLRTDLFSDGPTPHALGVYLGPVWAAQRNTGGLRTVYGPGINYSYFPGGTGNRGMQVGAATGFGRDNGRTVVSLMFNLGYQF